MVPPRHYRDLAFRFRLSGYDQKPETTTLDEAATSLYNTGALDAYRAVLDAFDAGRGIDEVRQGITAAIEFLTGTKEEIPHQGDALHEEIDQPSPSESKRRSDA